MGLLSARRNSPLSILVVLGALRGSVAARAQEHAIEARKREFET